MRTIDAGGKDKFCGDDAHSLFFQIGGDSHDDRGMIQKALMANSDICRKASL